MDRQAMKAQAMLEDLPLGKIEFAGQPCDSSLLGPEAIVSVLGEIRDFLRTQTVPAKGYFNLEQAAAYLGVSDGTLREWIRTKRCPKYKPGKTLLFKRTELDAWMERFRTLNPRL